MLRKEIMISIEETKKVAELAKLEFDEKGLEKMSKELSNILGYMEILNDIDTENVIANEIMSSNINCIREDRVEKFENTKGILENAKTIGNMINVPSINNNEEE
jgi:aspartyl/glutamyl-tRNA(asn/gln) amidotransferase, C subunit